MSRANYGAKAGSVTALAALNFFVADVQTGMGPYLTFFLRGEAGWNAAQVGAVVSVGYLVSALVQIPIGALIDLTRRKRELLLVACATIAVASLLVVLFGRSSTGMVRVSQSMVGVAGAIFPPCLAAITLGLVGRKRFDVETGRLQSINAAGNFAVALTAGFVGYFFSYSWLFLVLVGLCTIAAVLTLRIRDKDIDNALARGADGQSEEEATAGAEDVKHAPILPALQPATNVVGRKTASRVSGALTTVWNDVRGAGSVLKDRRVLIFVIGVILFNVAALGSGPLLSGLFVAQEKNVTPDEARQGLRNAALASSGAQLVLQGTFFVAAARAGYLAATWGRKPLFLLGFVLIAVRALLYTVVSSPFGLAMMGVFDGILSGISAVVTVIIIADLTQGTGRFNLAQGAVQVAVGLSGALSNAITGPLANAAGNRAAFMFLAGVAAIGFAFYWRFMPETRERA